MSNKSNKETKDFDVGAGYENLDEVIAKSNPQHLSLPQPLPQNPSSISDSGKTTESTASRKNKSDSSKGPTSVMGKLPAKAKSQDEKVSSHGEKVSSNGNKKSRHGNKESRHGNNVKSKYKIVHKDEKQESVDPALYESMVRFICDYYMDTKKALLITGIITIFLVVMPLIADLIWLKYSHTAQLSMNPTAAVTTDGCARDMENNAFVTIYPYSQIFASVFGLIVGVLFMLLSMYFPRRRPLLFISIVIAIIELIFFIFAFVITIGYFIVTHTGTCAGRNSSANFWVQPSISLVYEVLCSLWCIFCIILGIKIWRLKKKGLKEMERYEKGIPDTPPAYAKSKSMLKNPSV